MLELSLEQQLELARRSCPGKKPVTFKGVVYLDFDHRLGYQGYSNPFHPSLTGEDWQKAQAADIIRWALNFPNVAIHRIDHAHDDKYSVSYDSKKMLEHFETEPADILTALIMAILDKAADDSVGGPDFDNDPTAGD